MAPNVVQQWLSRQDGLEKLARGTAPMPTAGEGEVLVEIKAVSFNYRDTEGESLMALRDRTESILTSASKSPWASTPTTRRPIHPL